MNKGLIAAVVAVVAIAAAAGIFIMSRSSNNKTADSTDSTNTMMADVSTERRSLREFMNLAGNQTCTFSDMETQSDGAIYAGGGKFRGDFTSVSAGQSVASHMVSDGTDIFVWVDGQPGGFKASLADLDKVAANTDGGSVDVNKQVDYECQSWAVDNSKFNTPNIEFTELGAMLQGMGDLTTDQAAEVNDANAMQCAACDSLPAESQAQCKQVLGC